MTTATSTFPLPAANLAGAQGFLYAVHAGMLASGWVQTSDTGQLGSLSSYNSTPGTVYGYRIYKWGDAQSATLGYLYAKISFVVWAINSSGTMYMPKPRVELSMGTDGAGNLSSPSALVSDVDSITSIGASTASRRASYHSYSTANGYSLMMLGGDFSSLSLSAQTNKLYPSGYPACRCHILLLAVRRLTDSSGNAVAGFSVISSGNQVRWGTSNYSHHLTSSRITQATAAVWGMEMFPSLAQNIPLVPTSLTPAVQLVNPLVVSSYGAVMPFQEVALYYNSATFTTDQIFTNRIAGVDRPFIAMADCGVYLQLADSWAGGALSTYDYLDKDPRTCLSFRWE